MYDPNHERGVIHQTWKRHELDSKSRAWFNSWTAKNPSCQHKLWNDTEVEALVRSKSAQLIWPIWDGLLPVERADAFRYLVLWAYGGYYADIDVACLVPISEMAFPKETDMSFGCSHKVYCLVCGSFSFILGLRQLPFSEHPRTAHVPAWCISRAPQEVPKQAFFEMLSVQVVPRYMD